MKPPVIFVGGDNAIPELMDDVAAELRSRGCEVIRGSVAPPPRVTDYPREQWPGLFGKADLMITPEGFIRPDHPAELAPLARRWPVMLTHQSGEPTVAIARPGSACESAWITIIGKKWPMSARFRRTSASGQRGAEKPRSPARKPDW